MTADTPARCEPPPELRGVDGWHWVRFRGEKDARPLLWWAKRGGWGEMGPKPVTGDDGLALGWTYVARVTPAAEVEALRADRDAAIRELGRWSAYAGRLAQSLHECAEDLAAYVTAQYAGTEHHPSEARRRARDMEPVTRARELLASAPPGPNPA